MTPSSVTLRRKPKGLLRGFFAIAQNDRKKRGRMTERRGFFGCLRNLRRCPEQSEGMTKKGQNDRKKRRHRGCRIKKYRGLHH